MFIRRPKIETYVFLMKSRVSKVNMKLNLDNFLLLWLMISLLGLAALAFEKLVISGLSSPMFGKYFEAKEITKLRQILMHK